MSSGEDPAVLSGGRKRPNRVRGRRGTTASLSARVKWGAVLAATVVAFLAPMAGATTGEAPAIEARASLPADGREGIPAFSRRYDTSCSTCHVAPGKLNAQGEAFRLNGYRFPVADEDRREDTVPLGADPWEDLWPEALWPGEIPGAFPLAFHLANDVRIGRSGTDEPSAVGYAFPEAAHLLAGAELGGGIAIFADVGWDRDHGGHLAQAKVKLQDPLPWLPDRTLNLWFGTLRPHLLTTGDRTLDQLSREPLAWQRMGLDDWEVEDPETGEPLTPESGFRPGGSRPAVELNGLIGGRLHYGIGAAEPADLGSTNGVSDVYAKVRYKVGGLGLDGGMPEDHEPVAWGGQLLDGGLTVEHFAYLGRRDLETGGRDRHRSFGLAVNATRGRTDLALGHIRGQNSRPWGEPTLGARSSSSFARVERLFYPWLLGSAKVDRVEFRPSGESEERAAPETLERVRFLPGLVALLRPNVRAIAEAELFLRDRPRSDSPHALWLRFDVAF